jgi:hypothetical protein
MQAIDQYMKENSLKIWDRIKDLKLIYLDTNFWLRLRDEANAIPEARNGMLSLMCDLVKKQQCLFPISNVTYYEVLKQQDVTSRKDTLEMISKLSGGIAIVDDKQRIKIEFSYWMSSLQKNKVPPAKHLVWGSLPIIIGHDGLSSIDYAQAPTEIQMEFFDLISKIPITAIASDAALKQHPFMFKDDVNEFNKNKKLFEHENNSFNQLLISEVGGMIEEACDLFSEAMQEKYLADTGRTATKEEIERFGTKEFGGLIYQFFKQNKMGVFMPFFRVCSAIYASFRWNKSRLYKDGNDTFDVMHAAGALPYFDYFFTERELHTIIVQQKLDELYGCTVASKPEVVLNLLDKLK